ncbi:hypothetical protein BC567DRAFT_212765 [Phyllosticta citribraziliensis]
MRMKVMIWIIFALTWLLAGASTLRLRQGSLSARQTDLLVDPYPCSLCDINDPLNVGPGTCTEARNDEEFCSINDESLAMSALDYLQNATFPLQQGSNEPIKWNIHGVSCELSFASYPTCDDHIFERQMLVDFFKWLRGDFDLVRWPQGYGYPSTNWIAGRLLDLKEDDFELNAFTWDGLSLWKHLTREMGSVYHKERLALVQKQVNNAKGILFRSARPNAFPGSKKDIGTVKSYQRNVTGVFQYLRQDEVWKLMTDTSKALESVFRTFDVLYGWDDNEVDMLGWPDRKEGEGRPGLRDLYCHWIDERLRNIEYNAGVWLQGAKAEFESKVITNPASPNEKQQWLDQYDHGILSEDAFKFPRVHQDEVNGVFMNSEFSMWNSDLGPAGPFP